MEACIKVFLTDLKILEECYSQAEAGRSFLTIYLFHIILRLQRSEKHDAA